MTQTTCIHSGNGVDWWDCENCDAFDDCEIRRGTYTEGPANYELSSPKEYEAMCREIEEAKMPFTQMTPAELREYLGWDETHPADLRETMRTKLGMLPNAARAVYCLDNIADPKTPLLTIVETVLYHFDIPNRRKVAKALGLEYDVMITMLVGYVLGCEHKGRL